MRPEDVGISGSRLVLGKHSGRHAFRERVEALGFSWTTPNSNRAFGRVQGAGGPQEGVFDADLEALVLRADDAGAGPWRLSALRFRSGEGPWASAEVELEHFDGRRASEAATGDGPVEAAFRAIEKLTGVTVELQSFDIRNVTVGEDAQGEAVVTVRHGGRVWQGKGFDTDIIQASAQAFLQAVNRICVRRAEASPDAA
jgi:2-isopropylmalate synthase